MDTQTQIDRLIELAIVQRSELKQLVSELPQLREYLGAEIERTFEEAEPQIRTELEEFCRARATDEHAKTGAALAAKVEELSKQLEITTAAKYSVLMAERAENVNLLAKAEARIEDAASMLSHAVKEIVTDELSRFPRAGEIDQLRKEFAEPRGLNPRGRWMPDETYQRLDLVTINGDSFVSNIDGNRERPSRTAGDWTLSAARGNGGGGGGVTTMTDLVPVPTDGQLLIGNGAAFVNATLTAGTGISISNGAGSITINATDGNITLDDGTAAAPSLNFTNEPTTGLFRASANVMGFAVNGTSRATMTTTGLTVAGTITPTGSVHAAAGSVGNPSLAFNSDQDTGLFSIGANNIGVAVGGAKVLDVASTGLTVTGALGATSLTSPAATNLTLAGGTAGSDSVVVSNTLAASSAIIGAFKVGNGTAATNVAIGGGKVNIGDTTAGSSGAGALVVAGGMSAAGASYFGGAVTATGANIFNAANNALKLGPSGSGGGNGIQLILDGSDLAGNGVMIEFRRNTSTIFYIGNGANAVGGSYPYDVNDAIFRSNKGFSVYCSTIGNAFHLAETTGAATFAGAVSPQQATTAAAPAYVKGAIYFDTTLNKLRVGGATAYETITSV